MWGLLERTKELAANIDKQLNESVGVEGGAAAASSSGLAGNAAASSASKHHDADETLNDAWNDDFDDGAFDDSPVAKKTLLEISTPTDAAVEQLKLPQSPPMAPRILEEENEEIVDLVPNDAPNDASGWDESLNLEDDSEQQKQEQEQKTLPPIDTEESILLSVIRTPELEPAVNEANHEEHTVSPIEDEPPIVVEPSLPVSDSEVLCERAEEEVSSTPPSEPGVMVQQESSKESSPVVVELKDQGWENDLYDDDDDDEEEDDEDDNETNDHPPPVPIAAPPSTISFSAPFTEESPTPTAREPLGTGNSGNDTRAEDNNKLQQQLKEEYELQLAQMKSQLHQVQQQLEQREDQLNQKAQQLSSLEQLHEQETADLKQKVKETKEEAKRRILKAKERADALQGGNSSAMEELAAKEETIEALRKEGQSLAMKQAEMVKAVRAAKSETRDLTALLEEEAAKTKKASDRAASLEAELKKTKEDLAAARRGESQAGKLEHELVSLQEESDRKEAANLSLQQQNKELKAQVKELKKDMELMQKGAMMESKRESNKLKKEHTDMVSDLEVKLRTSERDASVREDALRQEVTELRNRWQDAVRRADALSMDVQNSTAPLLRQLESMERQTRARAAAWAELETKLRTDLEEHVILSEKLTKERNELKANLSRMTRMSKDRDEELFTCKNQLEDYKIKVEKQDTKIEAMEREGKKMKEEWIEVERLANEGVSKVRSDMMKTVLESEERHQAQLKSIENELTEERKKRSLLERQVGELLDNAGMMVVPTPGTSTIQSVPKSTPHKKLRPSEGQADILAGALGDLGSDGEEEEDDGGGDDWDDVDMDNEKSLTKTAHGSNNSFAAMEQLSQRLKEAKVELEALRRSLASSERIRESLLQELRETRVAKEKLPLFEAKVQELAVENRELELEIMSLREDIAEIRHLYRGQLNTLLEEKAANLSEASHHSRLMASSNSSIDVLESAVTPAPSVVSTPAPSVTPTTVSKPAAAITAPATPAATPFSPSLEASKRD